MVRLYKFRPLVNKCDLCRIKSIVLDGFYCCSFFEFNDMNEGVYVLSGSDVSISLDDKLSYKICSFSGEKGLSSKLMWGHYAKAGMGVAIEVLIDRHRDKIKEVEYSCDLLHGNNDIEKILTHKSSEWRYEDEYRFLSNSHNGSHVKIGKIIRFYFGSPYKGLINYNEIREKHSLLTKYLELKNDLELFLNKHSIEYCDYSFD